MKKYTSLLLFFLLISQTKIVFSQNSKKETINRYQLINNLSYDEIKTKNYSHLAEERSIENFLIFYIINGKEIPSKKYDTEYIDSVYSDTNYIYFLHSTNYPLNLIKVNRTAFQNINFSEIDGNQIRQKFIDEIIPNADKEKVKAKKSKYAFLSVSEHSYFKYQSKNKVIEITYKWHEKNDYFTIIKKEYKANYNIYNKSFDKLNFTSPSPLLPF